MEATGVYHENLANWLYDSGAKVSIANLAHVKYYAKSVGGWSKNDKKDSIVLARYGIWQPAPQEMRVLKALLTRLDAVERDLQREKNRQEKALVSDIPASVLASMSSMSEHFEEERKSLEKLIDDHIKAHKNLKENKALLESIPGVGKVVAGRMLMLLGTHQFKDAHQCAAYLGLVPYKKNRAVVSEVDRNWLKTVIKRFVPNCTWRP